MFKIIKFTKKSRWVCKRPFFISHIPSPSSALRCQYEYRYVWLVKGYWSLSTCWMWKTTKLSFALLLLLLCFLLPLFAFAFRFPLFHFHLHPAFEFSPSAYTAIHKHMMLFSVYHYKHIYFNEPTHMTLVRLINNIYDTRNRSRKIVRCHVAWW